ncbi:MAG: MFS transporter [Bacillota bacterium]
MKEYKHTAISKVINKSMISMIVMVILIGMGEHMSERFLPLYIVALGGTAYAAGILNFLDNFLSAVYSPIGGVVSDRVGYKRALMIFTVVALIGYLIVILIPAWQAVLVGAMFFISWTAISLPAVMSMVSKVVSKNKRTMGVSIHSLVRRIPMAIGPVFGGALLTYYDNIQGMRIAFIIAFVLGVASLFFINRYMEDEAKNEVKEEERKAHFSPALKSLLLSDILVRFAEQIPYAYLAIWIVNHKGLTSFHVGLFTVIEMITALLVYIPVAYFADKYGKKPFVLITFGFFTLFPLVFFLSNSVWTFIFAFIIRGLKEFGEPTRKALIMDLAPENAKARTFGLYYFIRDIIVSAAALGGALLWGISPFVNFMTAFVFGVIGIIVFAMFGRNK